MPLYLFDQEFVRKIPKVMGQSGVRGNKEIEDWRQQWENLESVIAEEIIVVMITDWASRAHVRTVMPALT